MNQAAVLPLINSLISESISQYTSQALPTETASPAVGEAIFPGEAYTNTAFLPSFDSFSMPFPDCRSVGDCGSDVAGAACQETDKEESGNATLPSCPGNKTTRSYETQMPPISIQSPWMASYLPVRKILS